MNLFATRSLAICAALALPVLPAIGHAADARVPAGTVQECSHALAASLGTRLGGDHYVRTPPPVDPLSFYAPGNQLRLTARDPASHQVVARAICTYNSSGQVVRLSRDSLDVGMLPTL